MIYDVVIVGGGPVGLFLASELRLANCSVLVLERARDPHTPIKRLPFGRRGLSVATAEAFYRRGLLDDFIALQPGDNTRRQAGHFAGIPLDYANVDQSKWTYRLPSPADTNIAADMEQIETVLANRATASGAEIKRGIDVDGFDQSGDGVVIRAGDQSWRARWVVGCDGGRSAVRRAGGLEFVGTDPEFTGYSVRVDIANPNELKMGRVYTSMGMYFQTGPGVIAMADFDGAAFDRGAPITLEHVQSVLRRVSETDVTLLALHLATTWTDRAQQATSYRDGRVLLAGDAAHIHSPLGGQGLNLGLGDAMNLGWKLGAIVRGQVSDDLLDSYSSERHPVGARVLDWSRAQVALMRPSRSSRALEAIMRDLISTRDGSTYFAERVWGTSIRYELGAHPLAGRSAPDFHFSDGTTLGVRLREGKGLLVDFADRADLRLLAASRPDQLRYASGKSDNALGLSALLVRPDGVVAWASDEQATTAEIESNASRWFGEARTPVRSK